MMHTTELQDRVRRVRKEGSLKLESKAKALELITYAKTQYGYTFRMHGQTSFYVLVVDADD